MIDLKIPGSKSIAQRALICASLCPKPTILENLPAGDDVQNLVKALQQCGVEIENLAKNKIKVIPKRSSSDLNTKIFVGHGGTPLRFLLSFLCQVPGKQILDGSQRLRERPISPLIEALQKAGAKISRDFPLEISASKLSEEIEIKASASSQFLSSIMLSAPALGIKKIKVLGKKVSSSYLKLTIKVLLDFGIKIREKNDTYEISGNYKSPQKYLIEPDWASAGYLLGAILLTKSRGKFRGLRKKSLQPDAKVLKILEKMGLESREISDGLEFSAKKLQSPGEINCQNFPDSAQTIAVLSAFCKGEKTILTGLETLPFKECQRLEVLQSELKKIGVKTEISRDSIIIYGSNPQEFFDRNRSEIIIKTFNDHRVGMSFGLAQVICPGLKIEQPSVVKKSFPDFWNELAKLKNSAKKMAIIGDPVKHSLTPLLYNSAFAELGMNYVCEKRPVPREKITEFLSKNQYEKLAITAPHKRISAEFLAEKNRKLTENIINSLRYDKLIRGKNTDILGIREVLADSLKNGKSVLIIGAGNTAHSVLESLKNYDLKIFIYNRTIEKAENLARKWSAQVVRELKNIYPEIIISTVPFNCEPEIPANFWKKIETVLAIGYDGQKIPRILKNALKNKKKIRTGGDLLWAQWKYQFEFLFDRPAPLAGKNLLKSFTILTK